MDKQAFAACMKRNREKHNITIETLSEKIGIPIDKLIEFESGTFGKIKSSELYKISEAIETPPVMLMNGGGEAHVLHRSEDGKRYCEWIEY